MNRYTTHRSFEDVEPELAEDWVQARGTSTLDGGEASPAVREAWERVGGQGRASRLV